MTTVADLIDRLEQVYPVAWAEPWDSPGLQVGDPRAAVERVLLALDPTLEVLQEAVERQAQVLLTHHPLLFTPLERLDATTPIGAAVTAAIGGGVSVLACHTNADVADTGVSDVLASRIGVRVTGPLEPTHAGAQVKLVVFVPQEATHAVLEALARTGAGALGEYDVCSFRAAGTGTFRPSGRATPAKGQRREVNEVNEDRLEMLVPKALVGDAVAALRTAHPYEEPAFDLIALERPEGWGRLGLGRIGEVGDEEVTVAEMAERCRSGLGARPRIVGDPGTRVRRVALCAGSGASLRGRAVAAGADVLITADVKHHDALDAAADGLAMIDAGHAATEWPWVADQQPRLRGWFPDLDVVLAEANRDPFVVEASAHE